MEKIPTAEELYLKTVFPTSFENRPDEIKLWFETTPNAKQSVEIMISFAKLHVEQALKKASEKAQIQMDEHDLSCSVNKNSILNAYPLNNIK